MRIHTNLFVALGALLLMHCAPAPSPPDPQSYYLPDMDRVYQEYTRLDTLERYGELGSYLARENRDLKASELYVYAAGAFQEARLADSAIRMVHLAIDHGMANPNLLDRFFIPDSVAENPEFLRLRQRLDSISEALRSVSNFNLEMDAMEAYWPYMDRALADTASARKELKAFLFEGPRALRDFYVVRYGSVDQMYGQMINGAPGYYRYLKDRFNPDSALALQDRITGWMEQFKAHYNKAVFPKVFVVPGILNTGGTATEMGMFLGGDMYGRGPEMPTEELNDWQREVIMNFSDLPRLTLHELMHFQQNYRDTLNGETVLAGVIGEGVCDFLVELSSGEPLQHENLRFLEDPENHQRIFADLKTELFTSDNSRWLYNGGSIEDRPGDLGYTVGYLITKSYYENHSNKKQAVYELLNTDNFTSILAGSAYAYLLEEPTPAPLLGN